MNEKITYEIVDAVAIVRLNRPERKNAMDLDSYVQFADAIDRAEAAPAVRSILIAGGPSIFCSGNDVQLFLSADAGRSEVLAKILRFMESLHGAAKPIVAAVGGPAIGIGATMLLHCDYVVASDAARFQMPFARLGIAPEFGSSVLLQRYVGYQRAAEILFFGDAFDAATAHALGLVNRIVSESALMDVATERARTLTELPQNALLTSKAMLKKGRDKNLPQVFRDEVAELGRLLELPEAREAFTAFLERRKPDFSKLR